MSVDVSVLIDTYNHEKYIDAAIKSVLAQAGLSNATVEIIVIDDGSTDATGDIVQSYGPTLRYYRKSNGGQASAFNMGIRLCQGEIICFLDGDDWWHANKLSRVLEAFKQTLETCAVGHSFVEVDEVVGRRLAVGPSTPVSVNFSTPGSVALFHQFRCCLGTSRLAMRRSVALEILNIPETLVFEADEYMFTLLPTFGRVVILPEALTYYRIHGANLYQDSRSILVKYNIDSRLRKRASIFECLSKRLPVELQKRGCDLPLIDLVLGPVQVQATRLKLMTRGGTPFENFRSEWRAAVIEERRGAYSAIVLWMSLGLALLVPPKMYFIVKHLYANLLGYIRSVKGSAFK